MTAFHRAVLAAARFHVRVWHWIYKWSGRGQDMAYNLLVTLEGRWLA